MSMKIWLTALVCVSLALGSLACARPHVTLDRVLVKNTTASKITEVQVLHKPTNKFGKVNVILSEESLDIGLAGVDLLARQAVISWQDGNGEKWSVAVKVPYDQTAAEAGRHMTLVYMIAPFGRVTAQLQASN
jgi:hypothetical protein